MRDRLVAQFQRPEGAWGRLAGFVMAHRASNVERNLRSVALLRLGPQERLLELGCGPGVALAAAARAAREGLVVGLDHSPAVLAQARRRNAAAVRAGRVVLVEGSFLAPPADAALEGPFDAILAVNSLQFSGTPIPLLRSLRDRLGPGGRIAITFQSRRAGADDASTRRGGEEIAASLASAGYARIRSEWIAMRPAGAVCVLAERGD